jgi:3-oxoacyl-[acyl-carrier-protein] synthase I
MLDWFKAGGKPDVTREFQPLRVVSSGMCCAVGHSTPTAVAAVQARMNHFRETQFACDHGLPILGGSLYGLNTWGSQRLALLLDSVVDECLAAAPGVDLSKVALLVLGAEHDGQGGAAQDLATQVASLPKKKGMTRGAKLLQLGKAGIALALLDASALLRAPDGPDHVLLVALDSLLDARTIEALLDQERVATRRNADGLVPSEGAAALLLCRSGSAQLVGPATKSVQSVEAVLCIEGVAHAVEPWRLDGDVPARAAGLTQAMREASAMAKMDIADLDFHASGMTGEGWYAREVSMALSRCMERKKREFAHLMVSSSVGETGAASAVLTLAWLAQVMPREFEGPGQSALLHFAGDDGQRSAMVVKVRDNKQARPQERR